MFDEFDPEFTAPPEGTVFARQSLDDDHCFLCGELLNDENRTDEHVIPQWLQRRLGLWDQELTLINGTHIPYSQLRIPCCSICNNRWLGPLENEIADAMARGYQVFRTLPDERIWQWCSKIYYGILYRETQLVHDRSNPTSETIVDRASLRNLYTLHLFLQSLHVPFHYVDFVPHSLFVVETQRFDHAINNFDLMDAVLVSTRTNGPKAMSMLGIRCNDVGIICVFLDNGAQKQVFQKEFDKFEGIPLVPIQFVEFFCKATCKEYSRIFPSNYSSWSDRNAVGPCEVHVRPSPISGPVWGDFDERLYCDMLLAFGGKYMAPPFLKEMTELLNNEHVILNPSFLHDVQGRPLQYRDSELRPALYMPQSAKDDA